MVHKKHSSHFDDDHLIILIWPLVSQGLFRLSSLGQKVLGLPVPVMLWKLQQSLSLPLGGIRGRDCELRITCGEVVAEVMKTAAQRRETLEGGERTRAESEEALLVWEW